MARVLLVLEKQHVGEPLAANGFQEILQLIKFELTEFVASDGGRAHCATGACKHEVDVASGRHGIKFLKVQNRFHSFSFPICLDF